MLRRIPLALQPLISLKGYRGGQRTSWTVVRCFNCFVQQTNVTHVKSASHFTRFQSTSIFPTSALGRTQQGQPFMPDRRIVLLLHESSASSNRFQSPPSGYRQSDREIPDTGYSERNPRKKTIRQRVGSLFRLALLGTGAAVWIALFVAYLSLEEVKIQEVQSEDDHDIKLRALIFYDVKSLRSHKYFKKVIESQEELEKLFASEDVKDEIYRKGTALTNLWEQLKSEDGVTAHLGNPAQIGGYRCAKRYFQNLHNDVQEQHNGNTWNAECFVEGPVSSGLLTVTFERVDHHGEWIPTNVHLERVNITGEVLCNIARPLPLGLKNFTRLSK